MAKVSVDIETSCDALALNEGTKVLCEVVRNQRRLGWITVHENKFSGKALKPTRQMKR